MFIKFTSNGEKALFNKNHMVSVHTYVINKENPNQYDKWARSGIVLTTGQIVYVDQTVDFIREILSR